MPDEEKFCFFGTGRTNDLPSEAILFIISQSKEYPRLDCMAQDYVILGFSADKWNVYKAELEHDFSADKDKLEMGILTVIRQYGHQKGTPTAPGSRWP